jgi:hypothetical protein
LAPGAQLHRSRVCGSEIHPPVAVHGLLDEADRPTAHLWADTNRESREVKGLATQHIAELDRKMQEMAQASCDAQIAKMRDARV